MMNPMGVSADYRQARRRQFAEQQIGQSPGLQDRRAAAENLLTSQPTNAATPAAAPKPTPDVAPPPERLQPNLPLPAKGAGTTAKAIRRGLMQARAGLAYQNLPDLQGLIDRMRASMDPQNISTRYAGMQEQLNDRFNAAEGQVDRMLSARGLDGGSSLQGSAMAQLAAERARSGSDLYNQIQRDADSNRDRLAAFLDSLITGHGGAAMAQANQNVQDQLQKQQLEQQQQQALMGLLGSLGGAAGSYFGMQGLKR